MHARNADPREPPARLQLGSFELDLAGRELRRADGQLAGLRRQALEVLLLLGARSGQVVGKDELMRHVWPNVVVGDGSLVQAVADIRRTLDDHDHTLVRSVARRGYLLAPSTPPHAAPDDAPPSAPPHGPPATPRRAVRFGEAFAARPWSAAWVVLGIALLSTALTLVVLRSLPPTWQTPEAAARPPLPADVPALSIAVMPLAVEGDSRETDWLADALHADLITELQRHASVLVIARDTMATFRGKAFDPRQVARELGVRNVVRGSVRREGDQLRLNVALVDGESGVQRWADTFTAERPALPRALNDLAVQVERTLNPELYRAGAKRRDRLSAEQVTADDLAMRAFAVWYRGFNRDNVMQALALCETAAQRDPDSLRAWHGIAFLNLNAALNGWQPDRALALQRIEGAAAQLDRIDRDHYTTFNAKTILLFWAGDVAGMLRHTRAWTTLHPNVPIAHGAFGLALTLNGQFDEAVHAFERALRLSPRDTYRAEWMYRLSVAHFAAGRFALARDWSQMAAVTSPHLRWPPVHAAALWELGQDGAARQAMAAHGARHGAFRPEQLQPRLPGDDARFAPRRQRLAEALMQAQSAAP